MFCDVEALLIRWLSDQLPHVRVLATLPTGVEHTLPVVQVLRVGGAAVHQPFSPGGPLHDRADLDVDVYAATRPDAVDLAGHLSQLIPQARSIKLPGGVVTQVIENAGPAWRPDYNPQVARVGATYELTLRPSPSGD